MSRYTRTNDTGQILMRYQFSLYIVLLMFLYRSYFSHCGLGLKNRICRCQGERSGHGVDDTLVSSPRYCQRMGVVLITNELMSMYECSFRFGRFITLFHCSIPV